jgi:UDP-N-acetylglucosamine 2-epimerase (non-hydrolysing)
MAVALVAAKMHIPVAHQEAGMRSGDKKMPEEINRIVTDHVSDYLFPISPEDQRNLYYEGILADKIYLVGDPMIDNLLYYANGDRESDIDPTILVEIHRPSNVDDREKLREIVVALNNLSERYHVVFPIHPRTRKMIDNFNLWKYLDPNVDCCEPMGYFDFHFYMKNSKCVITDSDGVQQETSILNIPCVSIRDSTNIQYTVDYGTNVLVDPEIKSIILAVKNNKKESNFPEELKQLNDGNSSERIAEVLINV